MLVELQHMMMFFMLMLNDAKACGKEYRKGQRKWKWHDWPDHVSVSTHVYL